MIHLAIYILLNILMSKLYDSINLFSLAKKRQRRFNVNVSLLQLCLRINQCSLN